ncbi:Cytochrome c [Gillisia sp. Hel1_33_143]|uniref:c-type cytochrome n=1 Tax=Gillisia sp. Hel1_33_143 TaxID=1336796 RepID=UPI00087BCB8F|nr:cytochrome c [Gillisia sp. Hel1_33_143]SDS44177.1 Cytochrome c [Gillisia sp. Hel1_33_143]
MRLILSLFIMVLIVGCKSDENKNDNTEKIVIGDKPKSTTTSTQNEYPQGKEVYNNLCATCHLPSGKGIAGSFPPLDGSNWLTEKRAESIHAVKYGLNGPIVVNDVEYNNVMAPMGLTDQEVADVLNYTMSSWGNTNDNPITLEEVKAVKE